MTKELFNMLKVVVLGDPFSELVDYLDKRLELETTVRKECNCEVSAYGQHVAPDFS